MGRILHYHSALKSLYSQLNEPTCPYRPLELISYWDWKKAPFEKIAALADLRPDLMIDSGAHSAYMQRQEINIKEFLAWHRELLKEVPKVKFKVGLDVIDNPAKNIENTKIFRDSGLDLFPTFHPGSDPLDCLKWFLDEGYEW